MGYSWDINGIYRYKWCIDDPLTINGILMGMTSEVLILNGKKSHRSKTKKSPGTNVWRTTASSE